MIHYLELVEHIIDEQTSGIGLKNILIVVFVSIVVILIPGLMISKKKKQVETRRVLLYFFLFFYLGIMFLIALFRRKPVIDDYNIVTYFDFGAFGNGIFKLRQTIYNLLNKPADYIDEYDDEKEYTLDLFSFTVINNTIDYDKLTNSIPNNIQFVINNDYTGNKDLKLLPKSGSTALDIGQAFNKYPGIISFDTSIQILNFNNNSEETYKYIIKANDGMKIITKGNITLIFANDETLKLEQLFNNSTSKSTLKLIKQGTSKLIIKTKDFNVTKDSIIMVQQPIGINLVSNLQ